MAGSTARVLVVDDTPDVRLLLRIALSTDDRFDVVGEAANGAEAIDQARDLKPDIVVLDRQMPVLDGVQALPLIRQVCPDAVILLFTAHADEAVQQLALSAGADRVWSKLEVPLPDMADELAGALLDRLDREGDRLALRLGPLPSSAARVWIRNTTAIVTAVRDHPAETGLDLPDRVYDLFLQYLAAWLAVAEAQDEFYWAAGADPESARLLIEAWAAIDALPDETIAALGCAWSPPEGEPFFHALTGAVMDALARHESTQDLVESLRGQWGQPVENERNA
ncbi:MAG: hypothetical protein QOK43_2604 [Acidimicrobiaceae bacterium]|nr:hypothetical protein [Acidimicrobiaceae bacterium]